MTETTDPKTERMHLKKMLAEQNGRIIIAFGVTNGYEVRQMHHTLHRLYDQGAVPDFIGGFITFASGYLCAAAYGLPDMGYILRSEIVRQTDMIEQAAWFAARETGKPAFPIGVDIDTGYGNEPAAVFLTCRQVHKQGGQYVQIEDQYAINKSCGHMAGAMGAGKDVVSAEEMVRLRIRPAVKYARGQADFSVMARTDAVSGQGFEEGMRRGRLYAEAGADIIFIEAVENEDHLAVVAREFGAAGVRVIANMVEGSPKTPYKSPRELHDMGYRLAIYSIGPMLAGRVVQARYFEAVGRGGSARDLAGMTPDAWFDGFNAIIGREQTERFNRFFHEGAVSTI